ncbi:hypothetical protein SAMN06264365_113131 [Actinoplanes regularis]|uniref:DEAD-box RNA helicase Q domain-containing protein n=1 Tax=Actinoplanes regularis TaxID=52697 RepID=A0A239DGB4_9ACTN|nr:hypothetical protein Are01nite_52780 [Actinoplanes regularis]SNS30874.1 hypothetical protein SAMN06264365_113131 [Actinoplanes regularis]
MTSFIELGVPAVLSGALAALGITTPFPIQAATLPDSLAGRDLLDPGRRTRSCCPWWPAWPR